MGRAALLCLVALLPLLAHSGKRVCECVCACVRVCVGRGQI